MFICELVDKARVEEREIYSSFYEAMERACVDDLSAGAGEQPEYISLLDFEITRVEECRMDQESCTCITCGFINRSPLSG